METIEKLPTLKCREKDSHKGDFGRIFIIAGSAGLSGAAAMAGKSALRSGAGLVKIACPESVLGIIAAIEASYTTFPLPEDDSGRISKKAVNTILNEAGDNDVFVFGPGVGVSGDLQQILYELIELEKPLVIDADGLNNLAKMNDWPAKTKAEIILTPHPGEMKRLWNGIIRENMPTDRIEQAMIFSKQTKTTIALKGAETVVTDGEKVYINTTGNPGMATAGSGDVLTGCIAALLGQGLSSFDAAVLGVYVHGLAGDKTAEDKGQISMIATDIIEALPQAYKTIKQQ